MRAAHTVNPPLDDVYNYAYSCYNGTSWLCFWHGRHAVDTNNYIACVRCTVD